jgi:hypothetical protein
MRKLNYYKIKRMLHKQSGNQNTFIMTASSAEQDSSDDDSSEEENTLVRTFLNFLQNEITPKNDQSTQSLIKNLEFQDNSMNFYLVEQ